MAANSDMYGVDKSNFLESSYQVNDEDSIPVYANVQLFPCSICGRNFNTDTLRKHQSICAKSSQKKPRRIFDAGKQRATDSDVPYSATKETTQFYTEGVKTKPEIVKNNSKNWREGHESLVRTIREARQITRAIETGAPLPKQTPSQVPSDYIQCEFCQRHFNKHAAERHIPFCETQHKRKQLHNNAIAANNQRSAAGSGRVGRGYSQQNGNDTGSAGSATKQYQINSAPSTYASRRPPGQRYGEEKETRRPPINPNTFKKNAFRETSTTNMSNTPPRSGSFRQTRTRNPTGSYLPGTMRTGRTTENDDLNVMAAVGRVQTKTEASPNLQRRTVGMKTRSPSPARRQAEPNGTAAQPVQKARTPVTAAAKHCYECGVAFPVDWAKFCCECGQKRLGL